MRIVIVDLHCNSFMLCNLDYMVSRRRSFEKHAFFLREALKEKYEVVDYITGTISSRWTKRLPFFFKKMEAAYVLKKNGLKKVRCITDAKEIADDDLVIFYSHLYSGFDLCTIPGHKYCNANHFHTLRAENGIKFSDFLTEDGFEGYICEVDVLNDSSFFQKYLPTENKRMLLLPYVAEERFRKTKPFDARKNKALALGSVGIRYEMYREFYGTDQLHPMRRELLDRKDENKEQIECCIEQLKPAKVLFQTCSRDGRIVKFMKRFFNGFYMNANSPFHKNGKNAGYYNKDRVGELNDYKMFIYPEEVTGVPPLGFVEGMSCGCAYIGVEGPMYSKIGMAAGIHYIGYDGTYDDLVEKVRYYQAHGSELGMIAENGYQFVKTQLSSKAVFRRFMEQFEDR